MSIKRCLIAIFALVLGASAAIAATATGQTADRESRALISEARHLLAAQHRAKAMTGPSLEHVDRLQREYARLEAQAERGIGHVSPARLQELGRLLQELEALRPPMAAAAKGTTGTITGVVRDAGTLAPLTGITVRALDFTSGLTVPPTNSGASGDYALNVAPGKYVVRTVQSNAGATGYAALAYDNLQCPNGLDCPSYLGNVVTVAAGSTVPGIDLALTPGGAIAGTVTRAADSTPIFGVQVRVLGEDNATFSTIITGLDGTYLFKGLPAQRYRVYFPSFGATGLMTEAYANRHCAATDCEYVPVDWVDVTPGTTTTGIDLALDTPASLSGTVTDAGTGLPIANAEVTLVSEDGWTNLSASADATGQYRFEPVRPASYRVLATGPSFDPVTFAQVSTSYVPVVYPDVFCVDAFTPSCDPLGTGDVVTVAGPGANVAGIDFQLRRGQTIQGTVLAADTMSPLAGQNVLIASSAVGTVAFGRTDAMGNYAAAGIPAGIWYVSVNPRAVGYQNVAAGNIPCPLTFCVDSGTPVTVTDGGGPYTVNLASPPGATITGTIMDAGVGALMPSGRSRVELFNADGQLVAQVSQFRNSMTGVSNYSATGLAPGAYKAIFVATGNVGWIDTAFGGVPCPRGGCDQSVLPAVYATSGGTLTGISGSMARGAVVRGRVVDVVTGEAIPRRAFVSAGSPGLLQGIGFNNSLDNYISFGQHNGRGEYMSRTGFPAGTTVYASTFLLRNETTYGLGYVDQNYLGVACPRGSCGAATGTGITIGTADVDDIDFALAQGGAIAGIVVASTGSAPILGLVVNAHTPSGKLAGRGRTNALGAYLIPGLPPGAYFVATSNTLGYLNEVYPSISCEPFCNPLTGTSVTVTGTATTGGIDFALDLAASVSGTVNASNVPVEIYGAIGNLLRNTTSAANGSYAFTGLAAGTFYVRTRNTTGQADELWSGEPCVGDACNIRRGTPVQLAAGANATNRDLTLAAPGVITGQVTRMNGGAAQSGVMLQLLAASGAVALTTTTNGTGNYTFSGLAAGDYYLVTRGTPGLIDVSYPSTPCPAACNGLNGSSVAVTAGTTLPGVNIQLQDAGYISGSVKTGGTVPVVGAVVQAYNTLNVPTAQIATNASGNYQLDGLSTGQFYVRTQNSLGLVDQVFKAPVNLQCSGFCDVLSGTQVAVNAGSAIPLPDFNLAGGAIVSGRVTKASDGSGIALATVLAYDNGGNVSGVATANANGDYTIGGLRLLQSNGSPAGYYLRTANLSGFVNQLYKGSGNLSCSPTPCSNLFLGTKITVSVTPTAGINFALAAGSVISGTATDQFNNPLPTGTAVLYDGTGTQITTSPIDRGLWQFAGLANGTYYVLIQNNVGLVDQLYANVPCPGGACSITTLGTPIVLSGGAGGGAIPKHAVIAKGGVATIDLKLGTGQTIAGTVLEAGTDVPLAGVTVYFFGATGALVGQATTDGLGEYLSDGGFQPGTYYAATTNGTTRGAGENTLGLGYVNRLYAGQNCLLDCNVTAGTSINVSTAPVNGIDFMLATAGAGITGTVRDAQSQPLEQIPVEIYASDGNLAGTALTNSQGLYAIDGLPAGNYYARTRNNVGLTDGLFGGQPCVGACNPLLGTPIAVPAVAAINNIDISLSLIDGIFANGFEN